jgi:uncharacterized heparinase superfamily protein
MRLLKAAARNPVGATRFASSYSKRVMRDRLLRTPWFYDMLRRYTARSYRLRKTLEPEVFGKGAARLDDLLNKRLTVLGKTLEIDNGVNWLADFEGGEWPSLFATDYNRFFARDFSLPEYRMHGDVKRVWDLNKQHHFVDLARAYKQSKDPEYQTMLTTQFLDWVERFPYMHGIGWNAPLIVAQRAINWVICYNLDVFPERLHPLLAATLFDHGKYLAENLEIDVAGNNSNHLIGDLAALHLVGLTLQKRNWVDKSLEMLLTEVRRQIYEDGVDYEQSSGYHRYVLEFLSLVWYANGQQPPLLTDSISKMANFLNDIAREDGSLPFLSDWDGAKVWVADHHRPAELYALGGRSATSMRYPNGGYYILKGGPFHLIFDCGPVGMAGRQLATHGHSDLLSFCLDVEGEPFIIDPGSGTYSENREIHDYFRSTLAHNTIAVDGRDQCGLAGTWTLQKHPKAALIRWETGKELDRVSGEHDGYEPTIHRREIQLHKISGAALTIYDDLIGSGLHDYQCYFHLAPDISCEISDNSVRLTSSKSCLTMSFQPTLVVKESRGLFAPDYGEWIEAPVLVFEGKSNLPVRTAWRYEVEGGSILQ